MSSKLRGRLSVTRTLAFLALVAAVVAVSVPAVARPVADAALSLAGVNKTAKKALKTAKKANRRAMTPGPAGPQGPQGPKGDAGAAGAAGPKGDAGAAGTDGTDGTSVVSSNESPGPNCPNAGSKFVAGASTTYACNGANGSPGAPGPRGDPWTAGGTLPSGATETGGWDLAATVAGSPDPFGSGTHFAFRALSFSVPLAGELPPSQVHYVPTAGPVPADCENPDHDGSAGTSNPEAGPGHLCIYEGLLTTGATLGGIAKPAGGQGAGTTAAILQFVVTGDAIGFGAWAVTG